MAIIGWISYHVVIFRWLKLEELTSNKISIDIDEIFLVELRSLVRIVINNVK